ncbi:hypothetical protein MKW98_017276, partial [Papaver atlanticum]
CTVFANVKCSVKHSQDDYGMSGDTSQYLKVQQVQVVKVTKMENKLQVLMFMNNIDV